MTLVELLDAELQLPIGRLRTPTRSTIISLSQATGSPEQCVWQIK